MYLKEIEVQGFKSFANKMKFEFHNGVTCIVGPNGSGKSNVADAVRWVLGEQRVKQLRGGNMQDVIFAGTELRKPQSMASVSLVLDNSDHQLNIDYEEVTVTRRLFRSGESEYLINNNSCRLKDIYELFYDTGIGKEGYSIIGQGQIDRILSTKPEDRRELFDEAVGIVKFKRRKIEAAKKLESEQANMVRVNDIMRELERQVGPLARQSEAAKNYLKLYEELKTKEISLFSVERTYLEKEIEKTDAGLETVAGQLADVHAREADLRSRYEDVDAKVRQLENEINEGKEAYSKCELEIKSLEGQIELIREQIRSESNSAEMTESRLKQLEKEIEDKETEQQELFAKIIEFSRDVKQKNREKEAAELKLGELEAQVQGFDEAIAGGKGRIIELLQEKNEAAVELQKLETTREQTLIRKAELAGQLLSGKTEADGKRKEFEKLKKEFEAKREIEDAHIHREQQLTEQNQKLSGELKNLQDKIDVAQGTYRNSHARAESLKNIAERYEGYGSSIRKIMEAKESYPGIHGAVADIIHVEKRYEVAIEIALGGTIQNIVTDTERTAKQLVEYLKKNRYGRATFLPLDGMKDRKNGISAEVLSERGVIGSAGDLVEADAVYDAVVGHLLGRVVVADTIDNALALARKYRYTLKIVTLEGELLNPGGAISGGAYKNNSNLLGRKREIEELEESAAKAKSELEQLLKKQTETRSLRDRTRQELADVTESKQKVAIDLNTLTINMNQLKNQLDAYEQNWEQINEDVKDMELEVRQIDEQRKWYQSRIKEITNENEKSEKDVKERTDSIDRLRQSMERARNRAKDLAVEAANVTQQEAFLQENRERISDEIAALEDQVEALKKNRKDNGRVITGKNSQIEEIEAAIERGKTQMGALSAAYEKKQQERDGMQEGQKAFFDESHAITEELNLLNQEQLRLQNSKERLEEREENQVAYLWEAYELTPTEAEEMAEPMEGTMTVQKGNIADLKAQIKKLGNVNVNAIEEYKEVAARYEEMKVQYDDIVESEKQLQTVVAELEKGMRDQFNEKFAQIKVEFDKVFRELFGGGHGTLEIAENEDVIEAGIYINAQPPGKKLQNMMQLSGGEKALTAIALLFAIQNLKPSPFCLLDEIEAALDDSNVNRYARYLNKLTDHTQFILITHRRGTMAAADRLYGITMQEKGVSTLVSVNLIENQLDA